MQVDAFLKEHAICDYTAADFERDRETLRQLRMSEAHPSHSHTWISQKVWPSLSPPKWAQRQAPGRCALETAPPGSGSGHTTRLPPRYNP